MLTLLHFFSIGHLGRESNSSTSNILKTCVPGPLLYKVLFLVPPLGAARCRSVCETGRRRLRWTSATGRERRRSWRRSIRQRLLAEGHPDPEAEIRRVRERERVCVTVCMPQGHLLLIVYIVCIVNRSLFIWRS